MYRLSGVDPEVEMGWAQLCIAFIVFGLVGTLVLYAILRLQQYLPFFYPRYQTTHLNPGLATNTAVSFATTTTWQAYGGKITMSYTSQMVGLNVQNFSRGCIRVGGRRGFHARVRAPAVVQAG